MSRNHPWPQMRTAGSTAMHLVACALLLALLGLVGCRSDLRGDPPHNAGAPLQSHHAPTPAETSMPAADGERPPTPHPAADAVAPHASDAVQVAPPVSVTVPSVDISSDLVELGLNPDGTMEVPDDYDLAGWYVHAPRPGEVGPAVIAGHVDSKSGPAVFYRLRDVAAGDRIEVGRADGTVAVFEVEALEQYPKHEFPTARVYGDVDHPSVRLITCGGEFDRGSGHYRDNVVVYASLADG